MAAVSAAPPPSASQTVFPKSHVGFDSITTQIERKLLKRGFQFNVICVGKLAGADAIADLFFLFLCFSGGGFIFPC